MTDFKPVPVSTNPSVSPTGAGAKPVLDEKPPRATTGVIGWLRTNLFSSWSNTLITLVVGYVLVRIAVPLFEWAVSSSVTGPAPSSACRGETVGACWAFIHEKYRFILFGTYPFDQQWRPLLMTLIIIALLALSSVRRFWGKWLIVTWAAGLLTGFFLLSGGLFGLPKVYSTNWGGIALTLLLAIVGLLVAFPFAILLALGRRSDLPAVRAICVGYIELVRGVPLVSILFMAYVLFPLFMPVGVGIDTLVRVQIGFIVFAAAYMAEVIRGGLQSLPKGQYEAADALGLSYWKKMGLIILPQAMTAVIPPMVNTFIAMFKDTSLVTIIGLYDLLTTAKVSLQDPSWRGFYQEAYLFVGLIYFAFCFFMSRYSQWLERQLRHGHAR